MRIRYEDYTTIGKFFNKIYAYVIIIIIILLIKLINVFIRLDS